MAVDVLAEATKCRANALAARTTSLVGVEKMTPSNAKFAKEIVKGIAHSSESMVDSSANALLLAFMSDTMFEVRKGRRVCTVRFVKTSIFAPVNVWMWKCSKRAMNLRKAPAHIMAEVVANIPGKSVRLRVDELGEVEFTVPLTSDGTPDVDGDVTVTLIDEA